MLHYLLLLLFSSVISHSLLPRYVFIFQLPNHPSVPGYGSVPVTFAISLTVLLLYVGTRSLLQMSEPSTRLKVADIATSLASIAHSKIQCTILAQHQNNVLAYDETGLCVFTHKREQAFGDTVTTVSFTIDPTSCTVIAATNSVPIIHLGPSTQFRSCKIKEHDPFSFFTSLAQVKTNAKHTSQLCNIHVNMVQSTPFIVFDKSGSSALSLPTAIDPWKSAFLVNVVSSCGTTYSPGKRSTEPLQPTAFNRLFLTFDHSKRSFAFPAPEVPNIIDMPQRIDAPPSQLLTFATFQSAALGSTFHISVANVLNINPRKTSNLNCPMIQVIQFKLPFEPQAMNLTIFNSSQFIPPNTANFSATALRLADFNKERNLNTTADSIITATGFCAATPSSSRIRPRETSPMQEEGEII